MSRGNLRCSKCKTNYKPFSDTQFSKINIDYSKWLVLIKLFDLGISARRAAKEVDVSYPTALHSFDVMRFSILDEQSKTDDVLKGQIEADEAYFGGKRKGNRGRGARNKTIVFGILERNGKVHVEIVKNVKAKTLLTSTIRKVKKGSIVYTDKWKGYNSLIFNGYKHLSVDHSKMFGKVMYTLTVLKVFGVLPKRIWQSIMELVLANSCCTLKRWNGDTTTEMKILSHYCLIICWG